jgi:hypothetical protein
MLLFRFPPNAIWQVRSFIHRHDRLFQQACSIEKRWMKIFSYSLATLLVSVSIAAAQSDSTAELKSARRLDKTNLAESNVDHSNQATAVTLRGRVVDSKTDQLIASRVHLRDDSGRWYLVDSDGGNAVHYERDLAHLPNSPEVHTTLSEHPFVVTLSPGRYTLRIERGKEYLPSIQQILIGDQPQTHKFMLQRWINMADRGWYSGDTHVHRSLTELPNVMLAEDLNVAFPLSYWVSDARQSPAFATNSQTEVAAVVPVEVPGEKIQIDSTHVIYPRNTEYEIFQVDGNRQTLGAVFVLNHNDPLDLAAPPMAPVARLARQQGALLDLDKHSWPWSLMIVPIMNVDLFELSNNHVWQTEFGFRDWTLETIAPYMKLQRDEKGLTEWGWIDFGFQTYYALINCGFRMRITAGTASGVHPVQLGFGRVYVRLPNGFSYEDWIAGLDAGQSFVSTGPMLDLRFNGLDAGHTFQVDESEQAYVHITGITASRRPLRRIEVVVNGEVVDSIEPTNEANGNGGYTTKIDRTVRRDASFWTALRCMEDHPDDRIRFAHSNPVYVDLTGSTVQPHKHAVSYFIDRLVVESERLRGVLSEQSLSEYQRAITIYQEIERRAK